MPARRTVLAAAAAVLVGGCSAPGQPPQAGGTAKGSPEELLAAYGLSGKTAEQVVETLDQDERARPLPLRVSVRPHELLLSDGSREATMALPADRFYLSVAPYRGRTHDCYFHNLGTCQGEMVKQPVHLTITAADGRVLADKDATTYANGFLGTWVPSGLRGTVTLTAGGQRTTVPFDSGPEGATCLTTLKLT